jgi:hypothetical protein
MLLVDPNSISSGISFFQRAVPNLCPIFRQSTGSLRTTPFRERGHVLLTKPQMLGTRHILLDAAARVAHRAGAMRRLDIWAGQLLMLT